MLDSVGVLYSCSLQLVLSLFVDPCVELLVAADILLSLLTLDVEGGLLSTVLFPLLFFFLFLAKGFFGDLTFTLRGDDGLLIIDFAAL